MSSNLASGTKSLMSGERLSVRLPRRIVPICVSEPIGAAMPRLASSTPAISVLETAPRPTVSTPSLPVAGSIFLAVPAGDGDMKLLGAAKRNSFSLFAGP